MTPPHELLLAVSLLTNLATRLRLAPLIVKPADLYMLVLNTEWNAGAATPFRMVEFLLPHQNAQGLARAIPHRIVVLDRG